MLALKLAMIQHEPGDDEEDDEQSERKGDNIGRVIEPGGDM